MNNKGLSVEKTVPEFVLRAMSRLWGEYPIIERREILKRHEANPANFTFQS